MKFEIKNRYISTVQVTAEIECDVDASEGVKRGLAVRWAIKARANLAGANLARANLADADLADADLADADLAGANLAGANLARANQESLDVPAVPQIDVAILRAIEAGGSLKMDAWHTCETTHCRAGWAIHIAGERGRALEALVGPQRAGAMIYRASRPGQPAPWFFATDEDALADIRKCAAEQTATVGP